VDSSRITEKEKYRQHLVACIFLELLAGLAPLAARPVGQLSIAQFAKYFFLLGIYVGQTVLLSQNDSNPQVRPGLRKKKNTGNI